MRYTKKSYLGCAQAMDGNKLIVNTVGDEPVVLTVKDKTLRWELYCRKVIVTIEPVSDEEFGRIKEEIINYTG